MKRFSGTAKRPCPTHGPMGAGAVHPAAPVSKARLDENQVLGCEYGHYPWDDWEKDALAAGVPKDLAGLGRLTVREAVQHDWDERLKSLCGWYDQGQRMIKLALRSPEKARYRWNRLLETDGYRGEYDPKTGQWVSWR
jgi:hypothetical protein